MNEQTTAPDIDGAPRVHDVQQITTQTDTREILANAKREAIDLKDYYIVDVDSHHVELDSWNEILGYIDNPVLRYNGKAIAQNWPTQRISH